MKTFKLVYSIYSNKDKKDLDKNVFTFIYADDLKHAEIDAVKYIQKLNKNTDFIFTIQEVNEFK